MSSLEKDIFISYAHADNQPWGPVNDRWISSFDTALQTRLTQLLGRPPTIWRDNKLKGTDKFSREIVDQFPRTKILLLVLSPNYMTSEWCRKELQAFVDSAPASTNPGIDSQPRICKIIKTHVAHEEHPAEISGLLGYEFFLKDSDGRFQEFQSHTQSPYCNNYWQKLEAVADDLAKLIRKIEKMEAGAAPVSSAPEKTIYLAETSSDRKNDRKKIEQELEKEGFTILPDPPLQSDDNFRKNAQTQLSRCKLSIHLVGGKRGLIPEEEESSIVEIQNEVAARQAQSGSLTRLIWLAPGLEITGSRQAQFVEALERDAPGQPGTRLLKNSIEDFKTIIDDTLRKLLAPHPPDPPPAEGPMRVYLMHDKDDRDAVLPIEDYLFDIGFEVKVPLFEGSPSQLRQLHQDYLRLCDAMMIYYRETSQAWLESKLNDILKARGLNRTKRICASAVFITGEKTPQKERFRTHEADVIKHFGPFQGKVLEPFVARLNSGDGGA